MINSGQKNIKYDDVKTKVKRRFAIIGKRLQDKQGNILFAGTTLSASEEEILKEYIGEATQVFVGNFADVLFSYSITKEYISFIYSMNRVTPSVEEGFDGVFENFVVAYVANAVLSMNYPDQAKKYEDDMKNHLQAAIKLIYTKIAPDVSEHKLEDMTGKVVLENKPIVL